MRPAYQQMVLPLDTNSRHSHGRDGHDKRRNSCGQRTSKVLVDKLSLPFTLSLSSTCVSLALPVSSAPVHWLSSWLMYSVPGEPGTEFLGSDLLRRLEKNVLRN